jgi:hypothetical protein
MSNNVTGITGQFESATATVGERMRDAGQTLERAGNYLAQQDLTKMRRDLEGLVRRRPFEAMLIGLGLGFLLARTLRW